MNALYREARRTKKLNDLRITEGLKLLTILQGLKAIYIYVYIFFLEELE